MTASESCPTGGHRFSGGETCVCGGMEAVVAMTRAEHNRLRALVSEQAREIARLNDDLAYEHEMTLCVVDAMNEAQDALASLVRVFVSLHGHGESWVSAHRDRPDSDRITFMAELGAIRAAIAVLEARGAALAARGGEAS